VTSHKASVSWIAFLLFYLTMLIVTGILDWANGLLTFSYAAVQVGLISCGVGIFGLVGWRAPHLRPEYGAMLAFTIGIVTIIPAILMSLGKLAGFWPQYFLVAFGIAGGSLMGFLFVHLTSRRSRTHSHKNIQETEDSDEIEQ
jgi:hypothetical protein